MKFVKKIPIFKYLSKIGDVTNDSEPFDHTSRRLVFLRLKDETRLRPELGRPAYSAIFNTSPPANAIAVTLNVPLIESKSWRAIFSMLPLLN